MILTKVCTVCREEQWLPNFYKMAASKDGHSNRCKVCDKLARQKWQVDNRERSRQSQRQRNLKYRFGLSQEDYDSLLEKQDGVCAICLTADPKTPHGHKTFCVDHCHETGVVRGLLCQACNRGLGLLGDTVDSIQRTLRYLETH